MADQINDGGPAFPEAGLSGLPNDMFIQPRPGMTLRDYFAAKAMQGLLSHHGLYEEDASHHGLASKEEQKDRESAVPFDQLAVAAYAMANAMLKARQS
jgi:hypothetical protein